MSYGDDEHRISFRFAPRREGAHVKVVVWSGMAGMRGNCGELTFRPEDWLLFRHMLGQQTPVDDRLAAALRYAPEGATSHLSGVKLVHYDAETPIEIDPLVPEWPEVRAYDALVASIAAVPPTPKTRRR